jgi:hypothetical protein
MSFLLAFFLAGLPAIGFTLNQILLSSVMLQSYSHDMRYTGTVKIVRELSHKQEKPEEVVTLWQ